MGNGARLVAKLLLRLWLYLHMQDFDGSQSLEVLVFSQIHFSKRSLPDFSEQAVVAELLSHPISHTRVSFRAAKTRVLKGDAYRDTRHVRSIMGIITHVSSCL